MTPALGGARGVFPPPAVGFLKADGVGSDGMGLLGAVKRLLGIGRTDEDSRGGDASVTVERERTEPDAETEAAVKGTDGPDGAEESAAEGTDAAGSTGSVVDADHEGAAEPAEATGTHGTEAFEDGSDDESDAGTGETEREPAADEDDAAAAGTDAAASTESMVDEAEASEEPAAAAEPAEAAGPESGDVTTDVDDLEPADEETADGETTDEETADGETADDDGVPVDEIKGIGPAYAERLGEIGIETVADLVDADVADVAERTTVSEKRVNRWVDRAREFES